MPAPTALDNARTSTPDNSNGIQLATIVAQEGTLEIPAGVMLSTRIPSGISPDRSGLSADDTSVTDMSTVGFAGTAGANLLPINNCGALSVWCEFANSAGSATVKIVFYDAANNPLFISRLLTFSAATVRVSAAGDYMSAAQLVDTCGASKYRPYLKVKGTGNVDIFANPI
jgi:hypothetical protein